MKDALIKLLKVKSLVTIAVTAVFAYLAITKGITGEQALMIYTTIIAFYFGTQSEKRGDENGNSADDN